jgi:hypothetical protein
VLLVWLTVTVDELWMFPSGIGMSDSEAKVAAVANSWKDPCEGRIILTKTVRRNAPFSIRDNFDPDSNVTEESNSHPKI